MLLKCKNCPNGDGTIEKDGKLYECMCSTLKRISMKMPPYIQKATVNKEHLNIGIVRKPFKNHYIFSAWTDMKAVIKLVTLLNPDKFIKITSDREIRDVYVGSKSKSSLGPDSENEIINTLEDLVQIPSLVIIKTNELFYKNKAAPGAFEEALSYRCDRDKPTWVVSDRDRPFGKGSFSWSSSIDELLDTGFSYVDIPRINPSSGHENLLITDIDEDKKKTFYSEEVPNRPGPKLNSDPDLRTNISRNPKPGYDPDLNNGIARKPKMKLKPDPEEDSDEDETPKAANRINISKYTDSSDNDDDDDKNNPLSQYGSGVKNKFGSGKSFGRKF